MNRINPGDYDEYFNSVVNVEGVDFPVELIDPDTYGFEDEELSPKLRCAEHMKDGSCNDQEGCYKVHFHCVDVLEDNRVTTKSAGEFEPTVGLLHFVIQEPTKGAKICQDWKHSKNGCPRGRRCTFLHGFPRRAVEARKAERLVAELVGDSPAKSTKKHAAPTIKSTDKQLFPTLDGPPVAATPAPAAASPAKAPPAKAPAAKAPAKAPAAKGPIGAAAVVGSAAKAAARFTSTSDAMKESTVKAPPQQPPSKHAAGPAKQPPQPSQPQQTAADSLGDSSDDDDGDLVLESARREVASAQAPVVTTAAHLDPTSLAQILNNVGVKSSAGQHSAASTFPPTAAPAPQQPPAFAATLNFQAGTVLAVAALEPYAFGTVPISTLPTAEDVQAALVELQKAVWELPPYSSDYRVAVALYRSAVGNLSELLAAACPPLGGMKGQPTITHRWAGYVLGIQRLAAPLILHSDALHILMNVMAADETPRPSSTQVVTSVIRMLANVIDPRASKEVREQVLANVDALTLLELTHGISPLPEYRNIATQLRGHASACIHHDELRLDDACKRWVRAALPCLARHGADPRADGAIGALMQAVSRRAITVKAIVEDPDVIDPELLPFETLLIQIEQITSAVCLQRWTLHCKLIDGRSKSTRAGGHEVYAVRAPSGDDRELWLCVDIDPTQCLSFQQWIPSLFIGQYITVTAVEGHGGPSETAPLHPHRCILASIRAHVMYLKLAPQHSRPLWRPNSTVLQVTVEHNEWHLGALLHVRRDAKSRIFEKGLLSRTIYPGAPHGRLHYATPNLKLDDTQQQFVHNVLQSPRLVILRGPPGTGKTHSAVGAIQMIVGNGMGRVLACATSNFATNVLASFLHAEGVNVTRIFSESTSPLDVKQSSFRNLLNICNQPMCPRRNQLIGHDEITLDSKFSRASWDYLKNFDVVCTTTAHIAWMKRCNVDFKFVFVDECAQGTAAETMLPLTIAPDNATLVLIGDAKQLGPAIVSDVARQHGLAQSFFEKYEKSFEPDPATGARSPVLCTTLKKCYRCHPDILAIFNALYYSNYLESGTPKDKFTKVNCAFRRNQASHILFVDVKPQLPSGGFFSGFQSSVDEATGVTALGADTYDNAAEADAVVLVVKSLLRDNGGAAFSAKIGIITSFRHQVLTINAKLRNAVSLEEREPILVGTVDQYQGQEKPVVLLSMVRHTKDNLLPGSTMPVGFVGNCKKTNVAISRAESLLIVLGSRDGLLKHPRTEPWRNIVESLASRQKNSLIQVSEVRQAKMETHPQQQTQQARAQHTTAVDDDDW